MPFGLVTKNRPYFWAPVVTCAIAGACLLRHVQPQPATEYAFTVVHLIRGFNGSVSAELADAPAAPTPELRVAKWLKLHRASIIRSSSRFDVDRTAIAGVIAYEALKDVAVSRAWMVRSVEPGRVHYPETVFTGGVPVSQQVENLGLLPSASVAQRKQILSTARGASMYIGAIMSIYKDVAARYGYDLKCRPDLLTTLYSAWDFSSARALLRHAHGRTRARCLP
jgi:hypothetical protein